MIGLGGQDHHLPAHLGVAQGPVHAELGADGSKGLAQGLGRGLSGLEHNAHEEAAGLDIAELLGVDDVAAAVEQEARHPADDAGPVGAG